MGKNAIDDMLAWHHKARHYPGAAIHIEAPGSPFRIVSGARAGYAEESCAASADTLGVDARFRIASLTKGMVSMVALMLIDLGKLRLDMPVGELIPEIKAMLLADGSVPTRQPTLADALSHTAGFGFTSETPDPQARKHNGAQPLEGQLATMTREQFLEGLSQRVLTAEPGTQFQYGFSTDVVGQMIERVTDESLFTVMSDYLFGPLAMDRTAFHIDPNEHAGMPRAFDEDEGWHQFVGTFEAADKQMAEQSIAPGERRGLLQSGGGGLVATLDDVCAYARMIAAGGVTPSGQRLISESLFERAMSNQLGPAVVGPYSYTGGGFGFGLAGAVRNDWGRAAFASEPGEFAWSGVTGHTLFVRPGKGWFALMLSSNTASRVIVRFEFRRAAQRI